MPFSHALKCNTWLDMKEVAEFDLKISFAPACCGNFLINDKIKLNNADGLFELNITKISKPMEKISNKNLEKFSPLGVLSETELSDLVSTVNLKRIEENEILLLEGDASKNLYFVIDGCLKAEKISAEGRQQTLRFIGPGEIINELAVFLDESASMTVIAMEHSQVMILSQAKVEDFLVKNPKFSREWIKSLALRVKHLLNHVENLSLYTVEARLARLLLEEAENGVYKRQSWKTQSEIAAQLGTVLDVVNRNLQNFQKQGVIEINRTEIKILDETKLEALSRS